jgi:hypothetical protein
MKELLQDIKTVTGVSGVMILDKRREATHQLLPASLAPEQVKKLAMKLVIVANALERPGRIDLRFTEGWSILVNLPSGAVLVLTKDSVDFSMLRLVLKKVLAQLAREVDAPSTQTAHSGAALDPRSIETLFEVVNSIAGRYREAQGPFQVLQHLRKAKEKLLPSHPGVVNFFIDPNGQLLFGRLKEGSVELTVDLFARFLAQFLNYANGPGNKLPPGTLTEWLWEYREKLEGLDFFHALHAVKS